MRERKFKSHIWSHWIYEGGFWFRLFGRGLSISDHPPMFSERYGYRKVVRIGKWGIKYLKAVKPFKQEAA